MRVLFYWLCTCCFNYVLAQNSNGSLDEIAEFSTKQTINIPMPGGVQLATDVYLPITQDSLVISTILGTDTLSIELIPKGTQLIVYPTMIDNNGDTIANPHPYQLPLIFSRTPYNKNSDFIGGSIFPFLGYAYAIQDMRGRYNSEGVYMPMYSDGWSKLPYHQHNHSLDITNMNDSVNGRWHEDGWLSLQYMLHQWKKDYDLDNDGTIDTNTTVCNGSVGMFGASALGNSQYQLAAAHRIDTNQKGLKCIVPIVATNEHYNCSGYNNGVYRTMLSSGWISGQLADIQDSIGTDNDLQNNLHSPFDFGLLTKQEVIEKGLEHVTTAKLGNTSFASAYPNSIARLELDASRAAVNQLGEGDPMGQYSRYSNINVPGYHLTGWYDIFINGQIDTWNRIKNNTNGSNKQLQKLVIGPWAHQTIGARTTGDMTYPSNVESILGLPLDSIDLNNLNIQALLQSEILSWYRYNLNERGYVRLGSPMVRIPESNVWQSSAGILFRVPAADYDISIPQLSNYLSGLAGLPQIPVEIDLGTGTNSLINVDIPELGNDAPFPSVDSVQAPSTPNFSTDVADVRLYVIGPNDSLSVNSTVGNYWLHSDTFPLRNTDIQSTNMYLHANGLLDAIAPIIDEGFLSYEHDPDNPVWTVGGANMLVRTPQNDRDSQGQMNYADSNFSAFTMQNASVLQFESALLQDTLSMIGFPKATIYVSSNPQGQISGPTDTDFFVRILDVYPDGRIFNVVEGAVNARARYYAQSIYQGQQNDTAVFNNINSGQIYELQLELLPIAYTFGKQHRIKVLISSGNFPRYQSNANIPIETGEFFRRNPNDGQNYNYLGQLFSPRKADNHLYFSPNFPSRIELPIYQTVFSAVTDEQIAAENTHFSIYPNPAIKNCTLLCPYESEYQIQIISTKGQLVKQFKFRGNSCLIPTQYLASGIYFVIISDNKKESSVSATLNLIKQ